MVELKVFMQKIFARKYIENTMAKNTLSIPAIGLNVAIISDTRYANT